MLELNNPNSRHLIIFTRYPEVGKTKTRLIPLLGAEGAAQLQQKLTEQTLSLGRSLLAQGITLRVYFTGGNSFLMQQWLGEDLDYWPQSGEDLGQRMGQAFVESFAQGAKQVVLIGTDCPGLTPSLMNQAFKQLTPREIVLGPAEDGGYYLIGLSHFLPALFQGIDWGSDRVLRQTQAIIQHQHYTVDYLPQLFDLDRPADWRKWLSLNQ
ncbi:MAG: TIGR04282 family arsenosugar biosynthesis glycosyltransferase [Microcystaceae cyanobacterium]